MFVGGKRRSEPAGDGMPEWLVGFLFDRSWPEEGTPAARELGALMAAAPSRLAELWKAHRAELLARWAEEGREGQPWGATFDRDPADDPRRVLRMFKGRPVPDLS